MGEYGCVPDPQPAVSPTRSSAPKLYRSSSDRWIAGVCGGIAEHLGISSSLVRLLMVLAVLAGPGRVPLRVLLGDDPTGHVGERRASRSPGLGKPLTKNQILLVIGAGVLVIGLGWGGPAGQIGRHLGFLLPVIAVAVGAFLAWSQLDANERGRWAGRSRRGRALAIARPVVGRRAGDRRRRRAGDPGAGIRRGPTSALAAVAVLVGAAVIALPWVVRMWQGLQAEQTERIRATERADIAAHLHDSVLQTLALVQRRADDPATVIRLARAQERELREWLYADENRSTDSLASAVTSVTHEVEDEHGIPIEVVVTGDRPMDDGGQALVKATREALLNAVRHGAAPVSVYVEVGPSGVEAFVRDHGPGFEMGEIGDDRLGVRESILGRMRRHGGAAKIRRLESGTEIELTLPPLAKGAGDPAAPEAGEGAPERVTEEGHAGVTPEASREAQTTGGRTA